MLDDRVVFILNIHLMTHLSVRGCCQQAMDDVEHIIIIGIKTLVDIQCLLTGSIQI